MEGFACMLHRVHVSRQGSLIVDMHLEAQIFPANPDVSLRGMHLGKWESKADASKA